MWFFWACFRKTFLPDLRKLEKAAMKALMQIPQSARAMLRTSRLLGVRSSLIFRKEIIVKPFRQKPSRAERQNCLVWFNWKWKISTMILLFSLMREQQLQWNLSTGNVSVVVSLHAVTKAFRREVVSDSSNLGFRLHQSCGAEAVWSYL